MKRFSIIPTNYTNSTHLLCEIHVLCIGQFNTQFFYLFFFPTQFTFLLWNILVIKKTIQICFLAFATNYITIIMCKSLLGYVNHARRKSEWLCINRVIQIFAFSLFRCPFTSFSGLNFYLTTRCKVLSNWSWDVCF